jgi:hypothetical protein
MRLLALGLELPEDALANMHSYEDKNNAYGKSSLAPSFAQK